MSDPNHCDECDQDYDECGSCEVMLCGCDTDHECEDRQEEET